MTTLERTKGTETSSTSPLAERSSGGSSPASPADRGAAGGSAPASRADRRAAVESPTARLNRGALARAELERAEAQGRYAAQAELMRWVGAVALLLLLTAAATGSLLLLAGGVLALLIVSPIMLASSVTAGQLAERNARIAARRQRSTGKEPGDAD